MIKIIIPQMEISNACLSALSDKEQKTLSYFAIEYFGDEKNFLNDSVAFINGDLHKDPDVELELLLLFFLTKFRVFLQDVLGFKPKVVRFICDVNYGYLIEVG